MELYIGRNIRDLTPLQFTDINLHPLKSHIGKSMTVSGLFPKYPSISPLIPPPRVNALFTLSCSP